MKQVPETLEVALERLKEAEETLRFYALSDNWWAYKDKPWCEVICVSDREGEHGTGGKLARNHLIKYGESR